MPLSNDKMDMKEIGFFLYMKEQEEKAKEIIEDEFYITEEEKEFIEAYRKADDVTKGVIKSLYNIK